MYIELINWKQEWTYHPRWAAWASAQMYHTRLFKVYILLKTTPTAGKKDLFFLMHTYAGQNKRHCEGPSSTLSIYTPNHHFKYIGKVPHSSLDQLELHVITDPSKIGTANSCKQSLVLSLPTCKSRQIIHPITNYTHKHTHNASQSRLYVLTHHHIKNINLKLNNNFIPHIHSLKLV